MVQGNNLQTNNNIFSLFPEYKLEQTNVVSKDIAQKPLTISDSTADSLELKKEKSKKAKKILFGSTLASTILTAGVLSMVFTKGFHGSSLNKFSKLKEKLAKELQDTSASTPKDITQKTVYYAKKGTQKALNGLEATSNFATIKDWVSDKILRATKVTAKFADKTKNLFKKVVDKTLGKKYDKVGVKVKDLTSLLKHYNITNLSNLDDAQKLTPITIKGETKTLGEWILKLSEQTTRLETSYDKGFSLGARKLRSQKRNGLLSGISDKIQARLFSSKKAFLNPENYKTYVTQDVSSAAQQELRDDILRARKQVSNNIPSIYDELRGKVSQFSNAAKFQDKASADFATKLTHQLDAFKKCSGAGEAKARKKIVEEMASSVDDIIAQIKKGDYTETEQKELFKILESIKSVAKSTDGKSKGALEEIMTILKGLNGKTVNGKNGKIISDAEFKEISKLSSKISKGLDSATELEMGEYFLKQAELEVGSAAPDVLSLLFPVGVGAYSIAKGDDKDEKISATLTTCIPLVGSFATFVYGTTKMFSGAKNLIFSAVSGILLGKLGNYCDKLYKRYKASGSVSQVAKEEYNHFWTDITPQFAKEIQAPIATDTKQEKQNKEKEAK